MAKLVLSLDGTVLREHELTKERTTIGRKPHNDIQIDNLAISGEHAVIVTILNDSFLQDLDSTNGTQVNGRPVRKHFLQDNDIIEMAKYKIHYRTSSDGVETLVMRGETGETVGVKSAVTGKSPEVPDASRQPFADVGKLERKSDFGVEERSKPTAPITQQTDAGQLKSPSGAGINKPPGTRTGFPGSAGIQFLTGPNAGREIEITKNLTTLGKPGSHLAVIARRKNGYFLTHVEGNAFPFINGVTLDAKAHALASHDIIELGGVKMEFFIN